MSIAINNNIIINDSELKKGEKRRVLLESVLSEVEKNNDVMELCGGDVWGWLKIDLWKNILICNGLSDEGKVVLMKKCVSEKVKYPNMGDKSMKFLVESLIKGRLYEEGKGNKTTTPSTEGVVSEDSNLLKAA